MRRLGFYILRIIRSRLSLFCLFMFSASCIHAEEIGFEASWQLSSSHPGDSEAINGFNQRYSLGWNPEVTRAIFFDANMNYSRNVTTGNIIRESLSPSGSLQVNNDLFFAELSGLMTKTNNSQSFDQLDSSWEAVLASNWDYLYWPSLSVSLGQNWLIDSEQVHVTDTGRTWSEFVTEWESETVEAYYSYYTQLRDDHVERSSYDEKKHFGRIDYTNSFFADQVDMSFSGQLTDSTTDFSATGDGEEIAIRVGGSQGLAGVDPTPESGSLPGVPALIDGNKNSVAFAIKLHEIANFGIKVDLQQVDSIYVYTDEIDPLLIGETELLRWDLYSSDDGVNWQKEANNPITTYNRDKFRYQVQTGGLKRIYLKLVVTAWPPSFTIPITEIEAYRNESDSGNNITERQEYTRTLTELNLRYTPTTTTRFSYSLVWDNSDYNIGNDRRRIFQTGGIRWEYSQFFMPTFTINNTSTTNSDIEDTNQLSYTFNVQSILLPTLEANLGITRNENTTDGEPQSTNHTVHLYLTAALYPNLDTTLDINTNFNKNEELGTRDENLGLRWTLTARMRPTLLVDFIAEHGSAGVNIDEIINSPQSGGRATLNVNWRPSDLLSILVNGSQGYGEEWSNYQSFLFDTNLSLVRTSKTQVIVGYKLNSTEDETLQSLNANWSWNISEFFTMQSIANYIISQEDDSWYISSRLTATF